MKIQRFLFKLNYWSILSLIVLSLQVFSISAQDNYYHLPNNISPDSQISILTSSPSNEASYTVYGHAGLRIKDTGQNIDITLNYGIFDFTDDFLIRFLSGQTDYLVIPIASSNYIKEYRSRGSRITEIKLNLDKETKHYLWHYLINNIEPENRVYRYNFFYDNCSIRLLNIIKTAIENSQEKEIKLVLDTSKLNNELKPSTWRREINRLEASNPWLVLGTDLALGSQTDKTISIEKRCFLPTYLPIILPHYYIVGKNKQGFEQIKPLVQSIEIIYEGQSGTKEDTKLWHYLIMPSTIMLLTLILLYIQVWQFYSNGVPFSRVWDILSFSLTGIAGVLLCYISFCSEHPHVYPNYNLWVLNPLNLLIAVPFLLIKRLNNWAYSYHFANFVSQVGFIVAVSFLPQHFNEIIYALSLTLLTLSFIRVTEYKGIQKRKTS